VAHDDAVVEGLSLRRAGESDLPFLRRLYGDVRAEELAAVPWAGDTRARFLDSQFALQHTHYVTHFPRGDFLVVERDGRAVGRLYLDEREADVHIVDIGLLSSVRGHGIGTTLLRRQMTRVATRGGGVTLQVDVANVRARALYRRLGFVPHGKATSVSHTPMRWFS